MVSQARSGSNAGDGGFLSAEAPSSANCGAAAVILTAVGDNLHRVLAWLRPLVAVSRKEATFRFRVNIEVCTPSGGAKADFSFTMR